MRITNFARFPVIAHGWSKVHGHGKDCVIDPNDHVSIDEPFFRNVHAGRGIPDEIIVFEGINEKNMYHIGKGNILNFGNAEFGVTIRHHALTRASLGLS